MLILAVTALEKARELPPETWMKIGIAVIAIVVAVFIIRKIAATNRFVAGLIAVVVCAVVFFSWVYNRNEPAFLTPIVDKIAPFFPSKGGYEAKQQTTPKG